MGINIARSLVYHLCTVCVVLVLFVHCHSSSDLDFRYRTPSEFQAVLDDTRSAFRDATKNDISDITTIMTDAFSHGSAWKYVRPDYETYKNYTWHCMRADFAKHWDRHQTEPLFRKVVAIPRNTASGEEHEMVVSLGVWRLMTRNESTTRSLIQPFHIPGGFLDWKGRPNDDTRTTSYNCSAHLGLNQTRFKDVERQINSIKSREIDEAYPKQLYLEALATHPDWDGHGFAAQNLVWGTRLAKSLGVPVTLIATPAGYPLYAGIAFRSLKNVSIETLDGWGGGHLWFEVMDRL